jgi:hypothetical protein
MGGGGGGVRRACLFWIRSTLREISFTICPRHFSPSCTVEAMLAKCGLFALSSIAPDLSCNTALAAATLHHWCRLTFTHRLSIDCAFSSFLAMASSSEHGAQE